MKNGLFLCVLAILFFYLTPLLAQNCKEEYLKTHCQNIELKNDITLINDTNLIDYKIFLFGENHTEPTKNELKIEFLRHLYYKANVRIIVMEIAYSSQGLLDNYFMTGDSDALNLLIIEIEGDREVTRKMFTSIYDFNSTLNDSEKILVKAIDVEFFYNSAFQRLKDLLPANEDVPLEIKKEIKLVKSIGRVPYFFEYSTQKKQKKSAHLVYESIVKYDSIYKKYLGINYTRFKNIAEGMEIDINAIEQYGKGYTVTKERERKLYENFVDVINQYPNKNIFCQYGSMHTEMVVSKKWHCKDNWTSMGGMLNYSDSSPVKGKVCSTSYFYPNNSFEIKQKCKSIINEEDLPLFLKYCTTPFTMFKLDGENTPFKEMAEKFQYIVINKY